MPSTTAPILILAYTLDTLQGDTGLQGLTVPPGSISVVPVPVGAAYPRVVIESPSAAENLNALQDGYARIWSQPRVQISIISANENTDAIDAIAARIETVLDGVGSVSVTNGEVVFYTQDWTWFQPALEQNSYHSSIIQQYSTAVQTA